jgi:3-phenylpropionate/trans-cinnamate dioxygenase ferredoxin reductase subunit
MRTLRTILIVGASLAGLRAAEALRAEGFEGQLTLLGAEPEMPYDRPPLSKELLRGEATPETIALRIPADLRAEWILGDPATELDLDRRVVLAESGREIAFDGLLIATGSRPRRLRGLEAGRRDGVVELRTLADSLALRAQLQSQRRVVLVGGGFIGVELASSARQLGATVDVVTLDPPLIVAGELFSDTCAAMLADHDVRVHTGRTVTEVIGAGRAEGVVLDDGTRLQTNLVVVCVGAEPEVRWLRGSGLDVSDGVLCDAACAVLGPERIVAAGDVARWPNPMFGGVALRIEHWTNAAEQAAAAARTLLHGSGPQTAFASVPTFWSDHFGTRLQSVGVPRLADRVEVVDGSVTERRFVAAAYRRDELVGATAYGMIRGLLPYRREFARRTAAAAAR